MKLIKTNLCLTIKCKCGSIVAATSIYGGLKIEKQFTKTIAKKYNEGGKIEFVNSAETKVKLNPCRCIL